MLSELVLFVTCTVPLRATLVQIRTECDPCVMALDFGKTPYADLRIMHLETRDAATDAEQNQLLISAGQIAQGLAAFVEFCHNYCEIDLDLDTLVPSPTTERSDDDSMEPLIDDTSTNNKTMEDKENFRGTTNQPNIMKEENQPRIKLNETIIPQLNSEMSMNKASERPKVGDSDQLKAPKVELQKPITIAAINTQTQKEYKADLKGGIDPSKFNFEKKPVLQNLTANATTDVKSAALIKSEADGEEDESVSTRMNAETPTNFGQFIRKGDRSIGDNKQTNVINGQSTRIKSELCKRILNKESNLKSYSPKASSRTLKRIINYQLQC